MCIFCVGFNGMNQTIIIPDPTPKNTIVFSHLTSRQLEYMPVYHSNVSQRLQQQ